MNATAIKLPDAKDLNVLDVDPKGELVSANHLLDDHDALMRFHDEHGYLLLRKVLNPESVERARKEMFAVMVRHGLIAPDATEPVWTGKPFAGGMEESAEFSGISRRLIEHPDNLAMMAKILGCPVSMVPIVQYRTYPPGGTVTGVHQDGFFSPGIQNYKPVWMPMANCEREVGGVMLAVGQNKNGYLHNVAKPPYCPVPEGLIPDDSWATTDYFPGDVLIIHPATPHGSTPNRSKNCRVTMDTRVQSANDARIVLGLVKSVTPNSITVDAENLGERTFRVDEQTFIRVLHPGQRIPLGEFTQATKPGMRLVVVFDGDHATTLRKSAEG